MAKIKLVKGKAVVSKRNVKRLLMNLLTLLNTIAIIYILLNMYGIIELL